MASFKFELANIVTAFSAAAIGSRVIKKEKFWAALSAALETYDDSEDRVKGQHFVKLPPEAYETVSAGVGPRSANPEDYVLRSHRGRVTAFLRRELAAPAESLAVVMYTAAAYLVDPEVSADPQEVARITEADKRGNRPTHVVVAVLAGAGPRAPLTPHRFVSNLAGGNREAALWSGDEIRAKAQEIIAYDDAWCVVAD